MQTTRFNTLNSSYEVNHTKSEIRRVSGVNPPTTNQGSDGNWKKFRSISGIKIGESVSIAWANAKLDDAPYLVTSPVTSIEGQLDQEQAADEANNQVLDAQFRQTMLNEITLTAHYCSADAKQVLDAQTRMVQNMPETFAAFYIVTMMERAIAKMTSLASTVMEDLKPSDPMPSNDHGCETVAEGVFSLIDKIETASKQLEKIKALGHKAIARLR